MSLERKIKVQKAASVVELCRLIKDVEFAAGDPYVASSGLTNVIAFPPLGSGQQIFIKGRSGEFTIYTGDSIEDGGKSGLFHVSGIVSATDDLTRVKGGSSAAAPDLMDDIVNRIEALGI